MKKLGTTGIKYIRRFHLYIPTQQHPGVDSYLEDPGLILYLFNRVNQISGQIMTTSLRHPEMMVSKGYLYSKITSFQVSEFLSFTQTYGFSK